MCILGLCCFPGTLSCDWTKTDILGVEDYSCNPILTATDNFEWILGDPTIVKLGDEIHMFANEVFHGIIHYTASIHSPMEFHQVDSAVSIPGSVRPYAFYAENENTLYLYYEQYEFPLYHSSNILLKTAVVSDSDGDNKYDISWNHDATVLLEPTLDWEKIGTKRVGNPFVFFNAKKSLYWMYYSASSVHLEDSNIDEPIYLGLAQSPFPQGPWERVFNEPLEVNPGELEDTIVLGIGSLKYINNAVSNTDEAIVALSNRVTQQVSTNMTGSTITLVESVDGGISWTVINSELIHPTVSADPATWKEAYCYGYDTLQDPLDKGYVLVYYNARDGWKDGVETIGTTRLSNDILKPSSY